MADITMCRDEGCPKITKCHRYTAPVNEYRQSIFTKSPRKDDDDCVMFWDNKGYQKQEDVCGK
jgi:hypothetical protein